MSRAQFVVAIAFFMTGCFITADPSFEDPVNVPPSVSGVAPTPMFDLIQVDNSQTGGLGDAGSDGADSELRFFGRVRDANVQDRLIARFYLNLHQDRDRPQTFLEGDFEIPPDLDEDPYTREIEFSISKSRFRANCNVVEIYVSRSFESAISLVPAEEGDIGVGAWFVAGTNDTIETPSFEGCLPQ